MQKFNGVTLQYFVQRESPLNCHLESVTVELCSLISCTWVKNSSNGIARRKTISTELKGTGVIT